MEFSSNVLGRALVKFVEGKCDLICGEHDALAVARVIQRSALHRAEDAVAVELIGPEFDSCL